MKWDGRVPVVDGRVMPWVGANKGTMEVWESQQEMTFVRIERGRSAAIVWMRGQDTREQPMFLSEFARLVPYLHGGAWLGTWRGIKRGQNFGISPVLPERPCAECHGRGVQSAMISQPCPTCSPRPGA